MAWNRVNFGEFAPDVADFNVEVARHAKNAVPIPGGYRSVRKNAENYTITVATDIYHRPTGFWFESAKDAAAPVEKGHNLTLLNNNSAAPRFYVGDSEFQQTSGLTRATALFEQITPIQWDTELYIFGDVDPPQTIDQAGLDDGGTTKTTDLAGSPPIAEYGAVVRQQLVVGRTYESGTLYQSRLRWSAFGDATGWTNGTNQAGQEDLRTGGSITGITGGEFGLVFQKNAITRMNYIGEPNIWEFDPIIENLGCPAPQSIVQRGTDVYFWGGDTFYVVRNGSVVEPVGRGKVVETIRKNIAAGNIPGFHASMRGALDRGNNQIWWGVDQSVNNTRYGIDQCYVYDIDLDRWGQVEPDVTGSQWVSGLYTSPPAFVSGDDKIVPGVGVLLSDSTTTTNEYFDGPNHLQMEIETGLIFTEGALSFVRGVRPLSETEVKVSLITKDVLDDAEVTGTAQTPNADGIAELESEARYHRVRIDGGSGGTGVEIDKITGVMVDWEPAGEY